jgi:hypothetical protein
VYFAVLLINIISAGVILALFRSLNAQVSHPYYKLGNETTIREKSLDIYVFRHAQAFAFTITLQLTVASTTA